jgi:hypothetical protein
MINSSDGDRDGEAPPPVLRRWRNLYLLVLATLALVVTLLAVLSRVYS